MMNAPMVYHRLSAAELSARWRELLDQPGLPHMFELDEYGELVVMPVPTKVHQRIVAAIQRQIDSRLGGEPLPGLGVLTSIGVRIPDVVWQPSWEGDDPASPAPQICAEVLSPDNMRREISEKTAAYLAAGAREVIIVETTGRIRFFGSEGERTSSAFGLVLTLPEGTYPL
jgi:Uma2 family endonuclease